jgi:hypothetical protein
MALGTPPFFCNKQQFEAVATGSAVHATLQHVILFPALRGCSVV